MFVALEKDAIRMVVAGDFYIEISHKAHPNAYQQILDYIKQTTGHTLP